MEYNVADSISRLANAN